ncbi:MAG TPA: ABC transporter ATP-binding protein [Candidatus Elarobacter sp.]|nr:ABC transporter ATP-binding protein [Candidatus Elarobacter sp.]HEV2738867.1 ABC transporter ATP-binding protein [Candidatus Elarobacter sp.]
MSISVEHLTKRFGAVTALDDVSFDVPSGSVFGLLGPNGAGKTTTFKCMLGLAAPSSGAVRFDGEPLAPRTFEQLAYVAERSALYEWMRVREHLEMQRRAFVRFDRKRADELLELFGLDVRGRVRNLSKGMRTALSVVLAFAIDPELMVLDEPTSGLDPLHQRQVLKLIIDAAARGRTIVFSSHQIGQVEHAADHVAILQRGKVILAGPVDGMKAGLKIVEAVVAPDAVLPSGLHDDARISRVEQTGHVLRVTVRGDSEAVAAQLSATGAQNVRVVDLNLEDIFLNAVDPAPRAAGAAGRV